LPSHVAKQIVGGFISPTEWIELLWFCFSSDHQELVMPNSALQFVWNWGDNLLFMWFETETTIGVWRWLVQGVAQGDPTRGTIFEE
jgi:hypothetical protein